MKEIKFRAWDEEDKIMRNWEEVILEKEHGDDYWLEGYKENDVVTSFDHEQILEQYTGMKDKNGKEIYEGDVVIANYDEEEQGAVVWDSTELEYGIDIGSVQMKMGCFYSRELEIIGNIHEGVQE